MSTQKRYRRTGKLLPQHYSVFYPLLKFGPEEAAKIYNDVCDELKLKAPTLGNDMHKRRKFGPSYNAIINSQPYAKACKAIPGREPSNKERHAGLVRGVKAIGKRIDDLLAIPGEQYGDPILLRQIRDVVTQYEKMK